MKYHHWDYHKKKLNVKKTAQNAASPLRLPVMAASSVETWNSLSASSTSASVAKAAMRILARDSEIRTTASSCLQGKQIRIYCHWYANRIEM